MTDRTRVHAGKLLELALTCGADRWALVHADRRMQLTLHALPPNLTAVHGWLVGAYGAGIRHKSVDTGERWSTWDAPEGRVRLFAWPPGRTKDA